MLQSDAFEQALQLCDVESASQLIFGASYSAIKEAIYPRPKYRWFTVPKRRTDAVRIILAPSRPLKERQRQLLSFLCERAGVPRRSVHGFVKGRSVLSNAQMHVSRRRPTFVLNLDLKDFFSSITFYRVRGVLLNYPFNFGHGPATVLAHMCCCGGLLPQGAPTSPFLSNMVCRSMDKELEVLAARVGAVYSRYCDDITFSFKVTSAKDLPKQICTFEGGVVELGESLREIIHKHSFEINDEKTRIASRYNRMEVTGLTVNSFPNVPRMFVDRLRGALHAWKVHGYLAANEQWGSLLKQRKGARYRHYRTHLCHVVWGRLMYLHMVRGATDPRYRRYARMYRRLVDRDKAVIEAAVREISTDFHVAHDEEIGQATFVVEVVFEKPEDPLFSQGTGFAISGDLLVTCNHVLQIEDSSGTLVDLKDYAGSSVCATNPSGSESYELEVVARDRDRDLALLRFMTHRVGTYFRFATEDEGRTSKGTDCTLVGFPNHSRGRPITKKASQVLHVYPRHGLPRIEVGDMVQKGISGGPLIDGEKHVIGVLQQGANQDSGNNEALAAYAVTEWLRQALGSESPQVW